MEKALSNVSQQIVSMPAETEIGGEIRLSLVPSNDGILQLDSTVDSLIVTTGDFECRYSINHKPCARTRVKSNQFFWIPTGHEFQLRIASYSSELIVIEFPASLRQRNIQATGSTDVFQQPQIGVSSTKNSAILESMVSNFITSDGFGGRIIAEAISTLAMNELLLALDEPSVVEKSPTNLSRKRLNDVIEYIDVNHYRNIEVSELAEVANLSHFHFTRAFTASTGISPYAFILKQRVEHAKRLLKTSDDNIAMISYEVGFSSQSHMTDVFSRCVGITPARYRKAQTN